MVVQTVGGVTANVLVGPGRLVLHALRLAAGPVAKWRNHIVQRPHAALGTILRANPSRCWTEPGLAVMHTRCGPLCVQHLSLKGRQRPLLRRPCACPWLKLAPSSCVATVPRLASASYTRIIYPKPCIHPLLAALPMAPPSPQAADLPVGLGPR